MKTYSVLLVLFLILPVLVLAQEDDRGYIVKVGDKAPDFELQLTDGTRFKLSEQKGKLVMLQFTASWCSVCRREMPYIESEIWKPNKGKDFVLIGVNLAEPVETVLQFKKQTGISYPMVIDVEGSVFQKYAEKDAGVTRNVLIDKDGKIIYLTRLFNEEEFNGLVDKIKAVLSKKE